MVSSPPEFAVLVGEELSAVSFVRDYVEFHFDGPVLRGMTAVRAELTGAPALPFPAPGSRDALCALIGRAVTGVEYEPRVRLTVRLGPGAAVTIPLALGPGGGAEAAHFMAAPGRFEVWE